MKQAALENHLKGGENQEARDEMREFLQGIIERIPELDKPTDVKKSMEIFVQTFVENAIRHWDTSGAPGV